MIKALQKKFILSAMLAITILLVILLGAINIGNILISKRQNEQLIDVLLNEETMIQPPRVNKPKGFFGARADENFRMSAVYFTVRADAQNDTFKADTGRISNISDDDAIEICRTVIAGGEHEGKIQNFRYKSATSEREHSTVYLFLDTSIQIRSILTVLFFSLIAGIVCWLLMLLLVFLISKRAIRPIAENIERQKQFVTDAGHEIKTPLAIILANTEAMELYQGENKWSKNIREQTVRLNGLMQTLLTLAKADESRNMLPTENVPASELLSKSLEMFSEPMKLKQIPLCEQIDANLCVKANKEHIARLFSSLIDNAVKYSVSGEPITVSLRKEGKTVIFRIENTCDALPECPPEKLFDRFYRADSARTQERGGYGIGLSAAKTIAELYGGTLKASYLPQNKIAFTVIFPL